LILEECTWCALQSLIEFRAILSASSSADQEATGSRGFLFLGGYISVLFFFIVGTTTTSRTTGSAEGEGEDAEVLEVAFPVALALDGDGQVTGDGGQGTILRPSAGERETLARLFLALL